MKLPRRNLLAILLVLAGLNLFYILSELSFADESNRGRGSSRQSQRAIGIGLRGEYFDNIDFTDLKMIRIDPIIHFNWGNRAPNWRLKKNTFSVRWTGRIQPRFSETYAFSTRENDGVRVWIDDQLIIDDWTVHSKTVKSRGYITLEAGVKYNIKIEYFDSTGDSIIRFYWSSPSQKKEIVPQAYLYPTIDNESSPLPTISPSPIPSITPIISPTPIPTNITSPTPTPQPVSQIIYLRPNADSFEQEWDCLGSTGFFGNHFQAVSEDLSDDSATYCKKETFLASNAGKKNLYKLPDIGNIGEINNVSVIARGRKDNINNIPIVLEVGLRNLNNSSSEYDGGNKFEVDNLWRNYEVAFGRLNPATGLPWTIDDINDLEIFHRLGSIPTPFGEKLVVTQIFLKIEYTPSPIPAGSISYFNSFIHSLYGSLFNLLSR